jgi:hypothetical protein
LAIGLFRRREIKHGIAGIDREALLLRYSAVRLVDPRFLGRVLPESKEERAMVRFACLATALGLLIAGRAPADTITLSPDMIAQVRSGPNQNFNNGGGPFLIWPSSDNNQGLLRFDLSSIKVPAAGATLKIYQTSNIFLDGPAPQVGVPAGSYDIYRNTSAWQQDTVTWNTKPSIDPASVATLPLSLFGAGWRSWDVTALANAWITGQHGNFGLTIARSDPGIPSIWLITSPVYLPGSGPEPAAQGVGPPPIGVNPILPELILDSSVVAGAPEPASLLMAGIAALGLIGYRRCRVIHAT